ncbi:endonuclease/exonuclease/phosphatase family protein [Paenibacillus sp. Marseille-Q4541]|uniref:endonuclease/exonuclease/phosphatase family protein n=1 Tax=Paenibacillus sp. Marseille-Q4541 TaxID=2831522 RepID=UPI001BAAAAE2|nr:endonuclease/exonuclease/phosphatase family protein [Paenibacillus sp. Marseille-Q4541]
MKILTLNTHAWIEENQLVKIEQLAQFINEHDFDVIALQEVNQSMQEEALPASELTYFHEAEEGTVVKADNYAYVLRKQLHTEYYWTYIKVHVGFEKYDEGLAILSKTPIQEAFGSYVSDMRDYENYRTRKLLGIKTAISGKDTWFVNGHFGWWHDEEEPFERQWQHSLAVLDKHVDSLPAFIMGDFNNAAHIEGEGYTHVIQSGWHDCFELAAQKDEGYTVVKAIAGWEENKQKLRIDYVFSNRQIPVKTSKVVLDGAHSPIVSDHSGVAVEI